MTNRFISRRNLFKAAAVGGAGLGANVIAPWALPERPGFAVNDSHWSRELPSKNAAVAADIDCDVAIIGGGLTGLSSAFYLKQASPDARVVVLEAQGCGNGASGRNGAMLLNATGNTSTDPGKDTALFGALFALTRDNIVRLEELSRRFGIDCELDLEGSLTVSENAGDAARFADIVSAARQAGVEMEVWDGARLASEIGTRTYSSALYEPHSGQLHPGKLVTLWKTAAQSVAADIYEDTVITSVEHATPLRLRTATGRMIRANKMIIATNAYSSKLGYFRNTVIPIINHVAITRPIPQAVIDQVGWRRRIPFADNRLNVSYLGLTRDNRIHIGGGVEQYEFNNGVLPSPDTKAAVARLRKEFERLFPTLASVPFESAWWGLVDMSADQTPAVGRYDGHPDIYYAIGLSGHGVNLTSVLGRILADLISDRGAQWEWFPYLNRLPPYIPNEPWRWLGMSAVSLFLR